MPLKFKEQPASLQEPQEFTYAPPAKPVPMSLAEIYGVQYSIATGQTSDVDLRANTHRASMGQEPEMRAAVSVQMAAASNEARKNVLDDFLSNGMVDEAETLIQRPEPIPYNMATETAMVEQATATRLLDPDEKQYSEGEDIPQAVSDETRALAVLNAIAGVAGKMPDFMLSNPNSKTPVYAPNAAYLDDALRLVFPMLYSAERGMAEGNVQGNILKDILTPGSEAEKEAKALWSSKTDAEFSQRLDKLVAAYGKQWESAPLVQYVALLESLFMGQKDNPQVQRILAMSKIAGQDNLLAQLMQYTTKGEGDPRFGFGAPGGPPKGAPIPEEVPTLGGLFMDPYVVNALNLFDVYGGAVGAIKGLAAVRKPLALYFGNKALATSVSSDAMRAARDARGDAALRAIVGLAREDADIVPEVQRLLDDGYQAAKEGLGDRVVVPRITPSAAQLDKEIEGLKDEYSVRFVGAQYRVNDAGDSVLDTLIGTKKNKAFASEKSALKHAEEYGPDAPVSVVPNPSGRGWLVKIERPVNEQGWYTGAENISDAPSLSKRPLARFLLSPISTIRRATTAGKNAALERGKLLATMDRILKPVSKLSPSQERQLGEVINFGKMQASRADPDETGRWFSYTELQNVYQTKFGRNATHKEAAAYYSYRLASDVAYHLMNETRRSELLAGGMSTWNLKGHAMPSVIARKASTAEPAARILMPDGSVISPTEATDIFTLSGRSFTFDSTKYTLLRAEGAVEHGKRQASHILANAEDAGTAGLQHRVVGYTEGGTRNYLGTWFVKQRNYGRYGAIEEERLPLVHGVHETKGDAIKYANEMEAVRKLYKEYRSASARKGADIASLRASTSNRMAEVKDGMSLEHFEELIESGHLNENEKFSVVFDRDKLPGEIGPNFERVQSRQKNGRLYYSARGEHLNSGEQKAALIDPFTALSKQMNRMVQTAAFNNFMIREVGEWGAAFGEHYRFKGNVVFPSAMDLIRDGEWAGGNSPEMLQIRRMAEGQRMYIRRMLNQPGTLDVKIMQMKSTMAQKLSTAWGEGNLGARALGKVVGMDAVRSGRVLTESQVIATMRSVMYNVALGFFHIGQFVLQGTAAMTAAIINPTHGIPAAADFWVYTMARTTGYNKSVLKYLDKALGKKGLLMPGGVESLIDDWQRSGLGNIGRTDPLRDFSETLGVSRVNRAINWTGETLRMPLYEGERMGRFVAFGIARREALEAVEREVFKQGSDEYLQFIQSRSSKYTLNMMSGMETWWQRNTIAAIPTQFMQFPAKYAEVFFGLDRDFTAAELWRFRLGHMMMYGSFGIPFAPDIIEWATKEGIVNPTEEEYSAAIYGMGNYAFNKMIEASTGTNPEIAISPMVGPGEFMPQLLKEIFYDGTPLSTAGGISYDILKRSFGAADKIIDFWAAAIWKDGIFRAEDFVDATLVTGLRLAEITKSGSNYIKAYYLHKYGMLLDSRGNPIDRDSNMSETAVAMGYRSMKEYETWSILESKKSRDQRIYETATMIAQWQTLARAELYQNGNTDKYQEYHENAMMLAWPLPVDERIEAESVASDISDRDFEMFKSKNANVLPFNKGDAQ